jgi:SAM-dependent methyltransferase
MAFAGVAETYERGRREYPVEAIEWALTELGLDSTSTVVDLAAGTGKISRLLAPRTGRLIAVEPLPEMRAVLASQAPTAEILDGTAEQLPLADASVDGVFVGEAFHWFDGDRALAEIHRVLRPGGGLAVVFGTSDWDTLPWNEEIVDRLNAVPRPDVRPENRPWTGLWKEAFDRSTLFGPLQLREFPMAMRFTIPEFQLLISTWSFVAALPDADRAALLDDVAAILHAHDTERFELPSTTAVHLTLRAQDEPPGGLQEAVGE